MKIRMGFVSNSSTTSFCIYGALLTVEEVAKRLGLPEKDAHGAIYDLAEKNNLSCYVPPDDYGEYYLGVDWPEIGDNETGAEFKKRVTKKLKEVFHLTKAQKYATHSNGWYDG